MAGVKVTISGFVAPLGKSAEDQPFPAVITGTATLTGLGVGGGPIMPPAGGGAPVFPAHPIVLPPEISGPPGPWPTPPIYLPPDPGHPPPLLPTHPIVYRRSTSRRPMVGHRTNGRYKLIGRQRLVGAWRLCRDRVQRCQRHQKSKKAAQEARKCPARSKRALKSRRQSWRG